MFVCGYLSVRQCNITQIRKFSQFIAGFLKPKKIYKFIYTKNLNFHANLNPSFMKEIFVQKDMTYSLRNKLLMRIPKTQTSRHGIESLSFLGSKLWNNLPEELKNIKTLPSFKRQIKGWKDNCNCRLCREFVSQVGFIT